ncbi:SulP family inorganic anion transporter [Falsiroseomonas selenitidurans]|uniref:Sulfate permease n=1 Tax=Falsiroseomonas selenitidurans TaxID=2716335 RepID=A0ABX1DY23_9PROT|nr:sulfate permease [Falsiroseomonas selenitidurans]NKC29398.1 sulfate permease [Falsiroseomonas selenitidurans]
MRRLASLLPILDWAPRYTRTDGVNDLFAAVIVTIMLVPQSLAYAMLAGLPPVVGLYASILPLVAYALFGTSRTLAVGPVAVVSLMTAAAVAPIAVAGSAAYVTAAVTLAFLSGLVLLAMAVLRLGFLANFLSHPVISGFITASGILIAASQLKHILGIRAEGDTLPRILVELAQGLGGANLPTLAIGVAATGFLFWARRSLKALLLRAGLGRRLADLLAKAGPLAAIILSILAVVLMGLDRAGVRIVGEIPAGLPPFAVPSFDPALWVALLPAAVLISLVGFVESVSVAQTLAAKRRQRIVANQELVGLGTANLASAISGGYPVTGGFARSVVNFDAGAATPLAGAATALGILGATLFLTPLFRYLPQAVLAATIIVAVLSLVDLAAIRRTWTYSRADFAAMAATILLVLLVGVEAGIVAGVALSLLLFLWRTSTPHMAIVGQVPGTEHFRNVDRHAVITEPAILSLRVDESLYFANARYLEDRIYAEAAARPALQHVILMCPAVNLIDASALESLEAIADRLQAAGVGFHLSEVKGPVMDALKRSDFFEHFKGRVFLSQFEAVQALVREPRPKAPGPAADR